MKNNKADHKHLPMIDNYEFMCWGDIVHARSSRHHSFDMPKKRQAFTLIHRDGLTNTQAGKKMGITRQSAIMQSRSYIEYCDMYIKEQAKKSP